MEVVQLPETFAQLRQRLDPSQEVMDGGMSAESVHMK